MRVIADLHIHSRFSRATSKRINIQEIARFAKIKGLNLVGTGDFTHPKWMKELQEDLVKAPGKGLFKSSKFANSACFMITCEVSTIFMFRGETKKIHHLILTPNFETAIQVNDRLAQYGDLSLDGRPTLEMSASQLVEEVMSVSSNNEVIPAHAWTPWFSLFGAFSGFDKIEDCYQDMTKHIHALETGLSSDPPMNWRISALDKFTLVSNSDSHSCWPWRIGREANVLDLEQLTYDEVVDVIRKKDPERFKFTIETNPAYGKYHWSGHRSCNVSMPPQEAIKFGNLCPMCRNKLTKGVEQRVEELADRPASFKPQNAIGYMHLLPLSEIIATVLNASSPSVQNVWSVFNSLMAKFGSEYNVLIDASAEELSKVVDPKIAEAVVMVRKGRAQVIPGYDGVYGQLILFEERKTKSRVSKVPQRSLTEWCSHT
ncbi:MAG: endonuclease Q family protein [Candidatus Bathyarchaeota archaeon]|nr:endonuclease Q family protein [Candidatus Bathyarchaeota archaeon]